MSKYVNRHKRKPRTKDEVLELIKQKDTDAIVDEYIFRFGTDYCVREINPLYQSLFGKKYETGHLYVIQNRLLK